MRTGVELIAIERQRQIEELGFDYTHDALYADEQLATAGAVYALPEKIRERGFATWATFTKSFWPWPLTYWKPTPDDRIKELSKAGALIAAQIDYYQRKQNNEGS